MLLGSRFRHKLAWGVTVESTGGFQASAGRDGDD